MTRSLLIFQDSPAFGGHEAMFLRFLPNVVKNGGYDRIIIRHSASNGILAQQLQPYISDQFEVEAWPFAKRRAEPYLVGFRRSYAMAVRQLFTQMRPTTTLLLQGRVENCAVPLLAAPQGSFLVSYVPMAHRMADMGRAAVPGDWIRRRLYRRPDRFVVPGAAVVEQVRAAGGRAPIVVAENVVSPFPLPTRGLAREALGLNGRTRVASFLGRFDVRQKGLDLLAKAIRANASELNGWTFLFVGAGEGHADLTQLSRDLSGIVDIRCLGWSNGSHSILAVTDLLLMPSRWEGIPLVMLEAMAHGIPVLASEIDVFQDYLPHANRIDFAKVDLAAAMATATSSSAAVAYREQVSERLSRADLQRSSNRFTEALSPECDAT